MQRLSKLLIASIAFTALISFHQPTESTGQKPAEPDSATGRVFHDANGNGKYDDGEKGLEGIRVSNGRTLVKTDSDGTYRIPVDNDDAIFVIKPRNWRTPVDEKQIPRFYYIHKPAGSPKSRFPGVEPTGPLPDSIDFALTPQDEPEKFKAILFGDPQPRDQKEVDYIAHDVVEQLVGTDASFGVTLGDIVFDNLDLFDSQARTIALLGIPWYNVIGNHDINREAKVDKYSDETFERHFGPAYYSFDYGPAHFLVLDDVEWFVDDKDGKGKYRGGFGPEQMEFIKNDLAMIPEDQLVVLMMHIPLIGARDQQELYRLIEERPACISVSGHTHHHEHRFITKKDGWRGAEPHHHIVNVTVSGSWWTGAPDNRGIPHATMADGGPNGYSILEVDGKDYRLDYRAAGRPAEYQININAPEVVATTASGQTTIHANVFNGSSNSEVSMQIGLHGKTVKMERTVAKDPALVATFNAEESIPNHPWRKMSNPKGSTHLWKASLPANLPVGTHLITITATDPIFGKVTGTRVLRVSEATSTAAE